MMLDPDVAPPLSSNLWLRVAHAISEATPQSAFACLLALGWCLTVSAFLQWFRRAQVRTKRAPQKTPKEAPLDSRARGCMLGAAVGDALGAGCEMMTRDLIATTYGCVKAYIPTSLQKFGGENQRIPGCYTDDTEMALGLALSLTEMRGDVDTWLVKYGYAPLIDVMHAGEWDYILLVEAYATSVAEAIYMLSREINWTVELWPEKAFTSLVMMLGTVLQAFIVSQLSNLMAEMHAAAREFKTKLDQVRTTMRKLALPPLLRARIEQYYGYLWSEVGVWETSLR